MALSFIAINLSMTVRTEINAVQAADAAERSYFLAKGAIEEVLFRLIFPYSKEERQKNLFPYEAGMNHFWIQGKEAMCHVAILDESGKLDLNYAEKETLESLLAQLGFNATQSKVLAENIDDWKNPGRDTSSTASPKKADKRRFGSAEQLLEVPGMSREILYGRPDRDEDGEIRYRSGLLDYVTVYSETNVVNVNYAEPEVLAALPGMNKELAQAIVLARKSEPLKDGIPISEQLTAQIPGESLSFLTTKLSSRFTLVATGWVKGSAMRRSVRLIVKRNPFNKSIMERLIFYDEYWPLASIRKWVQDPSEMESSMRRYEMKQLESGEES
ncbi:MAG: type II secretion system protein GspK [Terriglobia bacterium]